MGKRVTIVQLIESKPLEFSEFWEVVLSALRREHLSEKRAQNKNNSKYNMNVALIDFGEK